MSCDLLIKNAMIVTESGIKKGDISVLGEKISQVGENLDIHSNEIIQADGLYAFPGILDAHIHFNEPGRTEWETIKEGSAGFAAGGGTLYFDMPLNSYPVLTDIDTFNAKLEIAKKDSYADFALWGGLTPESVGNIEALAKAGVIGFKAFACYSGAYGIERADDYTIFEGMKKLAKLNLPLMVHCENAEITRDLTNSFITKGKTSAKDYFASRPEITELECISRMIMFAQETKCKLIIAHVSSARGVDLIREAQQKGISVFCETMGHYLAFCEEDVERIGTQAKCSPPIRNRDNMQEMWKRLESNDISFISSDHSPCEPKLKDNDFLNAWGGIAGCQFTLPLMLSLALKNNLPVERLAPLLSQNAAQIFNIRNKGKIENGYDADIALVDLGQKWTLQKSDILYKHKESAYMGYEFGGKTETTILRGKTVFSNGKILCKPFGKLITPSI